MSICFLFYFYFYFFIWSIFDIILYFNVWRFVDQKYEKLEKFVFLNDAEGRSEWCIVLLEFE